jgi:hypothetical protein
MGEKVQDCVCVCRGGGEGGGVCLCIEGGGGLGWCFSQVMVPQPDPRGGSVVGKGGRGCCTQCEPALLMDLLPLILFILSLLLALATVLTCRPSSWSPLRPGLAA